jgi:hypothetical protein
MAVKKHFWIVIAAIAAIMVLDIVALCNGIDGILMTSCVAVIAGLAGLVTPTPKELKL